MELVNEWSTTGKFRKVDTPFRTDSSYKKELISALPLTGHALHRAEMDFHGEFGHTLGRIQRIALMNRTEICYDTCRLDTQTVATNLPGFQCIKRCVQYLDSQPHKPIFYTFNSSDGSNSIRLTWSGNRVEDHTTHNCLGCNQDADHAIIFNRRWSVSYIIHTLLGVDFCWKLQIQPAIESDSTDG